MSDKKQALVLLSGGQDSATCLAWALERYEHVETIGFEYGQRHSVELQCRALLRDGMKRMNPHWRYRLGQDHLIDAKLIGDIGQTAMTSDAAIRIHANGLPSTFVPGRNLLFLTLAAAIAYRRGLHVLVTGVCETDYSGYPDCRDDTIKAQQVALSLGMDRRILIETPLMWIDKAKTWHMALALGGEALVELIRDQSHSCYLGERHLSHAWGQGCGHCPACELRAKGWERFVNQAPLDFGKKTARY